MPLDQAIPALRQIYAARPSEDVGTTLAFRLTTNDPDGFALSCT